MFSTKEIMTKNILLLLCISYLVSCKGQEKSKELKFPQVGWTLSIPANSDFLTELQFDSLQNATKKKTNLNIELSKDEVLFVIKKDSYNYFGSSVTVFDTSNFKTHKTIVKFLFTRGGHSDSARKVRQCHLNNVRHGHAGS